MVTTRKKKLLIWITVLAFIMACVPALGTPVVPTVDAGSISTFIAQTVNAASTQTALVLPSSTLTPSITPTQNTETPSPTVTSTVNLMPASPTPIILPTFTSVSISLGGSGTSSDNYACQVTRVRPPNGSSFDPREDFDAFWTVKNIGKRNWDRTDVDYVYSTGDRIHKVSGYDLEDNVKVGNSIEVGVDMQAPKDSGTYTTTWTMRVGERTFCPMRLSIVVR